MDWKAILYAVGGALVMAAVHYIRTGKPPLFDPEGKYPVFDLLRDGCRRILLLLGDHFWPGATSQPSGILGVTKACGDPNCPECAHLKKPAPPAPPVQALAPRDDHE